MNKFNAKMLKISILDLSVAKSNTQKVCFIWNDANYFTLYNHLGYVTKYSKGLSDYYSGKEEHKNCWCYFTILLNTNR